MEYITRDSSFVNFTTKLPSFLEHDGTVRADSVFATSIASVLVLAFSLLIPWLTRRRRFIRAINRLPGPKQWRQYPWLAEVGSIFKTVGTIPGLPFMPRNVDWFLEQVAAHDGLFHIWIFGPYRVPTAYPIVFISDNELIRELLTNSKITSKLEKERNSYGLTRDVVGDSFLAMRDVPEWKHQRKLAALSFRQNFLEYSYDVVLGLLYETVFPKWDQQMNDNDDGGGSSSNALEVEMTEWTSRFVIEVLGIVAFSCPFGGLDDGGATTASKAEQQKAPQQSLYQMYKDLFEVLLTRSSTLPFLRVFQFSLNSRYRRLSNQLDSVIGNVVQARLSEEETPAAANTSPSSLNGSSSSNDKQHQHKDLLSYLLRRDDDGTRLSYKHLFGNVRMFLFAGHDTTHAILSRAMWELATHPSAQRRLQAEIDTIFDDKNGMPAYKDVLQLKYLDAVVKETLRLHGAGAVARTVADGDIVLQKASTGQSYLIPQDTAIFVLPILATRNAQAYPDRPFEFFPDRFLSQNDKQQNAAADKNWIPFSVGPRNCVAQPLAMAELKTVLCHLFRRYSFTRGASQTEDPISYLVLSVKPNQVSLEIQRRR